MRAAGAAGVLASVLILIGLYLSSVGASGTPGIDAAAEAWAAWARREENAMEVGTYLLLVPGLVLFLCMFAALVSLLPRDAISTRLAGYGAIAFVVLFATAGVMSSTPASTFGFFPGFQDPSAVTVFTWVGASYHLQTVGTWMLAMTIAASAVGLRGSAALPFSLYLASFILAVLAVAASFAGLGVIPCLVWIVAVAIGLLRWRRSASTPPPKSGAPSQTAY
jgi:hypothetical protein